MTQTWPTRTLCMTGLLGLVQTGQTQLNLSWSQKICWNNQERGLFPFLWAGSYEDRSLEHQEPSPFLGKNLLEKETRGHRGKAEMRAEEREREKDPMYCCRHTAPGSSCSWSPFSHEPAVRGFLPLAPHVPFLGHACSSLRDCLP